MVSPGRGDYPDRMTDIFDVIADPTRRAILQLLRDRLEGGEAGVDVPTVVDATGASRQSVNRQLTILSEAGLLVVVDDGPHRTYALDTTPLETVEDWLAQYVGLAPQHPAAVATAFSAWSGADAGETIGRAIAERSQRARSVVKKITRH
jgi:DNA-binding transcriptional ArsR family regulator